MLACTGILTTRPSQSTPGNLAFHLFIFGAILSGPGHTGTRQSLTAHSTGSRFSAIRAHALSEPILFQLSNLNFAIIRSHDVSSFYTSFLSTQPLTQVASCPIGLWPKWPQAQSASGPSGLWSQWPLAQPASGPSGLWPNFPLALVASGPISLWLNLPLAQSASGPISLWSKWPQAQSDSGPGVLWPK